MKMTVNIDEIVEFLLGMRVGETITAIFDRNDLPGLRASKGINFLEIETAELTVYGVGVGYYPYVCKIGERLCERQCPFIINVAFNPRV